MKKLVALISTQGKTSKQILKEVWEAFQKYFRVKRKVEKEMGIYDKKEELMPDQLEELVSQWNQELKDKGFEVGERDPVGTMQVIFRPKMPAHKHQPSLDIPPDKQEEYLKETSGTDSELSKFKKEEKKIDKKQKGLKRFFTNVINSKTYEVSLRPKNEKSF